MGDKKRKEKKVCVLGSGNGGSAVAKMIAENCAKLEAFQDEVTMYVYEELIDGRKLTDIINETHENVKYLPGTRLGSVVAVPDLEAATRDADVLVFAFPHDQIKTVCASLVGKIKHSVVGVVMVKGLDVTENGNIELASRVIGNFNKIHTCVFTGLTFPGEVVSGKLCETSLACKSKATGAMLLDVIQTDTVRIRVLDDLDTVELFGTLRCLVGCAAGIADAMDQEFNCKAAIFRLGLIEVVKFLDLFYPHVKLSTVFECCGVADMLLSCYYGHDRRVTEAMVRGKMSLLEAERKILNGKKLEGARVANDIHHFLRLREVDEYFPMFTAVHRIFAEELEPEDFLSCISSHPEHNLRLQRISW